MSKLTGHEIIARQASGEIFINPWRSEQVNPNSYDLRLAPVLVTYKDTVLDPKRAPEEETHRIPEEGLVLEPHKLYLGLTEEIAGSTEFVPCIYGKSSIGRLGLFVHVTAGFGDVGFVGRWTLELMAIQPIRVYPAMRVCQIYFDTIHGEKMLYKGRYAQLPATPDLVPTASRLWQGEEPMEARPFPAQSDRLAPSVAPNAFLDYITRKP